MIPTSIPDQNVAAGSFRHVFAGPNGDLTDDQVRPAEGLVTVNPVDGVPTISLRLVLEDGEMERLSAGKPVWLTMLGTVAPFDVQVEH